MPIGVERGSLAVYTKTGKPFKIYAYGNGLTARFPGLTKIDDLAYAVGPAVTVQGHKVRRYPGDPGYNKSTYTRKSWRNRGRSGASATPGNRFWIELAVLTDSGTTWDRTQYTYTGEWAELQKAFLAEVSGQARLRRESSTVKYAGAVEPPSGD